MKTSVHFILLTVTWISNTKDGHCCVSMATVLIFLLFAAIVIEAQCLYWYTC